MSKRPRRAARPARDFDRSTARPTGGPSPADGASRPPLRRPGSSRSLRRWLAAGGGLIALALLAAGFVLANSGGQSLPGISTGQPPWSPESANLRARLEAIGLPVLSAEGEALHIHEHLDIFVDGQAVAVPADIGINTAAGYLAPIHTHDETGIIHVESPVVRDFTLGQFFDIWGVRFDAHCIGGACDGSGRTLQVFVNGQRVSGDPRAVKLESHQEIVVALGTTAQLPSPVPSSYAFQAGL